MPEPAASVNREPVAWSEIFSRHETNLNNHVEICGMVKSHVISGSRAFDTLCSMIDCTQELIAQMEELKKQFLPRPSVLDKQPNAKSIDKEGTVEQTNESNESEPPFFFDKEPKPVKSNASLPMRTKNGRKRLLDDNDGGQPENESRGKNKKSRAIAPVPESPVPAELDNYENIPIEREDISAQVEARLLAKKEERKKRLGANSEKRKRWSNGSNTTSEDTRHKPKKQKIRTKNGDGSRGNISMGRGESNGDGVKKAEERKKRQKK